MEEVPPREAAGAEEEWAVNMPQDPADNVCVRVAEQHSLMPRDSRAVMLHAQNVVHQ